MRAILNIMCRKAIKACQGKGRGTLLLRKWPCHPFSSSQAQCHGHCRLMCTSAGARNRDPGLRAVVWTIQHLGGSTLISPGKGRQHQVLFRKVVGCVGFQRKRDFFQGRPLLPPLYICYLFSKQEPCSLSQASATISRAQVEQLKATRALSTRRHQ